MRLLMLDNYDSFTFNLVQYLGELGAECDVVRNDEISAKDTCLRVAGELRDSPVRRVVVETTTLEFDSQNDGQLNHVVSVLQDRAAVYSRAESLGFVGSACV